MDNEANATRLLRACREMGVHVALDDFGTGYSSLRNVQVFPVDTIKIDKSFVQSFGDSAHSTAIVAAILGLAAHLKISTTAEGVEDQEHMARLGGTTVDQIQGYFMSRPLPLRDLEALIPAAECNAQLRATA